MDSAIFRRNSRKGCGCMRGGINESMPIAPVNEQKGFLNRLKNMASSVQNKASSMIMSNKKVAPAVSGGRYRRTYRNKKRRNNTRHNRRR